MVTVPGQMCLPSITFTSGHYMSGHMWLQCPDECQCYIIRITISVHAFVTVCVCVSVCILIPVCLRVCRFKRNYIMRGIEGANSTVHDHRVYFYVTVNMCMTMFCEWSNVVTVPEQV